MARAAAGKNAVVEDPDYPARVMQTCLGTRISQLQRRVGRLFDSALREAGLTIQQMEMLTALSVADPEPVRPAQLATWLAADRSTTSRNLMNLQSRGWVEPAGTSVDGRTLSVQLTDAGRQTYRAAEPSWQRAQRLALEEFGTDSVDILNRWLSRLSASDEAEPAAG